LSGWKSSQVAELFDLSRCAVVKWIRKANDKGIGAVNDMPRAGRPSQFDEGLMSDLEKILSKSPKEFGIPRVRWDGVVFAEYLKRVHYIKIHVRHAQRLIHKLGYSLRQPIYRFVQASGGGVKEFHEELKKTPPGYKKQG
jgi:transposase